jgi:hypothetical protein
MGRERWHLSGLEVVEHERAVSVDDGSARGGVSEISGGGGSGTLVVTQRGQQRARCTRCPQSRRAVRRRRHQPPVRRRQRPHRVRVLTQHRPLYVINISLSSPRLARRPTIRIVARRAMQMTANAAGTGGLTCLSKNGGDKVINLKVTYRPLQKLLLLSPKLFKTYTCCEMDCDQTAMGLPPVKSAVDVPHSQVISGKPGRLCYPFGYKA